MKTRTQDLIVRLSTATVVALTTLVSVHGLANVSQHHIERNLAQYSAQAQAVQLAQGQHHQQA